MNNNEFKFSSEPTLEDIRLLHAKFVKERDWGKFHSPRNILLALVGEMGELAEIFQWSEEVTVGCPEFDEAKRRHLEEELSDVLTYLVRLADRCHVDLPSVFLQKMQKNAAKYPVDLVKGSATKYTTYEK